AGGGELLGHSAVILLSVQSPSWLTPHWSKRSNIGRASRITGLPICSATAACHAANGRSHPPCDENTPQPPGAGVSRSVLALTRPPRLRPPPRAPAHSRGAFPRSHLPCFPTCWYARPVDTGTRL